MHLDGVVGPANLHSPSLLSGSFMVGLRAISPLDDELHLRFFPSFFIDFHRFHSSSISLKRYSCDPGGGGQDFGALLAAGLGL